MHLYVSFTFSGFAELLHLHFPNYEMKVLNRISKLFIHKRVSHINFLIKEKKRLKNESQGRVDKSLRDGVKIAQYTAD